MRPKIALCFPNFNWQQAQDMYKWQVPPHTLCILAAVLRDFCDVDLIDANKEDLTEEEFAACLLAGDFDFVGISILMDTFSSAGHLTASLVKKTLPQAIVCMGGVYPTMSPQHAMSSPNVDYVCIGEGEYVLPELVRHLFLGGEFPRRGFAWRADGEVKMQDRAPFIEDLDALPFPAYDLLDFASYTSSYTRKTVDGPVALPHINVFTTRGCPMQCTFCQAIKILGRRVRGKSPEKVLDELQFFKDRYGIKSFTFLDDNTFANRPRIVAILRGMIERKLDLPWKSAATAVFSMDEELLELMAESGCKYICIAIESGSPRILKEVIHKPIDLEQARRMTRHAQSLGIYVAANFIIGFPGETWEEIRQTVRTAEDLGVDYMKLFSAIPLQHTALWKQCEEADAFAPGFDPYTMDWNKGQIVSSHFDDRELTILRAYEWDRINFSSAEKLRRTADMMGISVEELNAIRRNTREGALAKLGRA